MSVKIMGALWERDLSMRDMLVLMALADHADHQGGSIRPGVPLIAWKCGLSERQTMRIMKEFEGRGILIRVRERAGKPVEYRMDLSGVPMKPEFRKRPTPDIAMSPLTQLCQEVTSHGKNVGPTPDIASAKTARIRHKEEPSEIHALRAGGNDTAQDAATTPDMTPDMTPDTPSKKKAQRKQTVTDKDKSASAPRRPDPVFDAVMVYVFGISEANGSAPRIGMAAAAIRKIKPDATANDVRAFVGWYRGQFQQAAVPRHPDKLSEHFQAWYEQFREGQQRQAQIVADMQQRREERVLAPLSDEDRQQIRQQLQEVLRQMAAGK